MVVFRDLCTDFMSSKGLFSEREHSEEFHQARSDSLEIQTHAKLGMAGVLKSVCRVQ